MLELVAVVLVAVWLMGLGASSSMTGFINFFLVVIVMVVVVRIIQRHRL
ncbi:lmo0937 family membrane protein [Nitratidesulfovibrio sp.]